MLKHLPWVPVAVVMMVVSGCQWIVPGDSVYAVGVARIGQRIHVLAPLCEGERIEGVEVYDNDAASKQTAAAIAEAGFTYWEVEQPRTEAVAKGAIIIGEEAAFARVIVAAGSRGPLPDVAGIELTVRRGDAEHVVSDVFRVAAVPSYAADADPGGVEFVYNQGARSEKMLTPAEIVKEPGCAFDKVA
ncbi:hypothetical protein ACIA59_05415 [Micromonospora haikouensis]|uniref:hypothetical protein n=1 Tax=Micromonospora haikouensis TaxID=686309 RepID=UPI0037A8D22B